MTFHPSCQQQLPHPPGLPVASLDHLPLAFLRPAQRQHTPTTAAKRLYDSFDVVLRRRCFDRRDGRFLFLISRSFWLMYSLGYFADPVWCISNAQTTKATMAMVRRRGHCGTTKS